MAEIRTVTTLTSKREELERAVVEYERALAQARIDLAHVIACIELFDRTSDPDLVPRYSHVARLFKRHELTKACFAALAAEGALDTRELAARVMAAKGFDPADLVIAKSVTLRVVGAMRAALLRGKVRDAGRAKNVRLWALPPTTF